MRELNSVEAERLSRSTHPFYPHGLSTQAQSLAAGSDSEDENKDLTFSSSPKVLPVSAEVVDLSKATRTLKQPLHVASLVLIRIHDWNHRLLHPLN